MKSSNKKALRKQRIPVYVTAEQRKIIADKATSCGNKSLSTYLLTVGLDKPINAAISTDERPLFESLVAARCDIIRFTNALQGTTQEVRRRLFKDADTMHEWYAAVNRVIAWIDRQISKATGNILPPSDPIKTPQKI